MARRSGFGLSILLAASVVTGCTSAGAVATPVPTPVATPLPPATQTPVAATTTPSAIPVAPTPAPTTSQRTAVTAAPTSNSGGYGDSYGGYGSGSTSSGSPAPAASGSPAAGRSAAAGGALVVVTITGLGKVLAGPGGMTLYTFKPDRPGVSTCNGGCADAWPPLYGATAPAGPAGAPGKVTIITRSDGSTQVAYDGAPLYTYAGDGKAGDANGQGSGGAWFVAAP